MEGFTAEQASRFTNCTAHQLRYWDKIDLVRPSIQATRGRPGIRRLYSFQDLVALRVIHSLLDRGMSLQRVRKAIQFLRKKAGLEEHLSEVRLISDGASIYQVSTSEGLQNALKEGQLAFFMALDDVAATVDPRSTRYLYDQEEFVSAVRGMESDLAQELPPEARRRVGGTRLMS